MNLNFLDRFKKKNLQTLYYIKIRPVGAVVFYTDGQTVIARREEVNSYFPQF